MFDATYLQPGADGLITLDQIREAIRPDTIIISVMWVNNEIGVIQPIAEIGELCREKGIIFHSDAAQATGNGLPSTVGDLTINNNAGLTLTNSVTVSDSLVFLAGNITTGANNVTVGGSGTVNRTSGHVVGTLRKNIGTGGSIV